MLFRSNLNLIFMTDPIADYLTRLRNAIQAKHRVVEVPASNLKKEITKILFDKGYILNYKFVEDGPQGTIKIALKYDAVNKVNAIKKLIRVYSRFAPLYGIQRYAQSDQWIGYRYFVDIQRCNDRQRGCCRENRW